jgi:hypothetical protein
LNSVREAEGRLFLIEVFFVPIEIRISLILESEVESTSIAPIGSAVSEVIGVFNFHSVVVNGLGEYISGYERARGSNILYAELLRACVDKNADRVGLGGSQFEDATVFAGSVGHNKGQGSDLYIGGGNKCGRDSYISNWLSIKSKIYFTADGGTVLTDFGAECGFKFQRP